MYNIFTVLNEGYILFGKLFVSSIFDKIDLDNINQIIIGDTGLSQESRNYFNQFPKIRIIDAGFQTEYNRIHDKDWKKNVYSKAKLLLRTIEEYNEFIPTIMIDADCIIIEDFLPLLEGEYDIAPCLRSQIGRTPGHQADSTHIGSFFVAKTENSLPFLKEWIAEIPRIPPNPQGHPIPQESPALSHTCASYQKKILIRNIDERIASNIEFVTPLFAKILHLKSDWLYMTIDQRIRQPRCAYYVSRYLNL